MAERAKSVKHEKKHETWEEREARRLARDVYDHLAYYIQVQLPEKKFVCETVTSRYAARPKKTTSKLKESPKDKTVYKRRAKSPRKKKTTCTTTKEASTQISQKHKNTNGRHNVEILTESSSSESEDESKKKQNDERSRGTRSAPSTPSRKPAQSARPRSSRPPSRRKEHVHETLRTSPYTVDPMAKDVGKSKTAESMRKEAERVAAHTTELLKSLSLSEVIGINKYRSPTKGFLRCSSSLSEHPSGMLTSDKAVEYAAKHDDREAARKYMQEKRQKEKLKARKEREKQREQLTSSQSYRRKYKAPLVKVSYYESSGSSTDSSDDSHSLSSTSLSSHSSASTVRRAKKISPRPSLTDSRKTLDRELPSDSEKRDFTESATEIRGTDSESTMSEKASTSSSESSNEEEESTATTRTSSDHEHANGEIETPNFDKIEINGVRDSVSGKYSNESSRSSVSSQSSVEASANFAVNGATNEQSGSDDVTIEKSSLASSTHGNIRSSSSSSSDEDPTEKTIPDTIFSDDRIDESKSPILERLLSSSQTSHSCDATPRVLHSSAEVINGHQSHDDEGQRSSTQFTDSIPIDLHPSAEVINDHVEDDAKGKTSSSQSSDSEPRKAISVADDVEKSTRPSVSSNEDVFVTQSVHQSQKSSKSTIQNQNSESHSESDNNYDTVSMTSSLRRIIEEAEISLSGSSSSSSSDDDSNSQDKLPAERIFGSSLPDVKQQHNEKGQRQYLESGGEILSESSPKSEFI